MRQASQLTIRDTLRVEVRLYMLRVRTNELKIDLILHVTHHDECCHHSLSLTRCHSRRNLAIPDVMRTGH